MIVPLLVAASLLGGCGGYGEISPRAYEYATALYAICNRRDESRLDEFSTMLRDDLQAENITEEEADWLADIVGTARTGNWKEATTSARRMLADQIKERE